MVAPAMRDDVNLGLIVDASLATSAPPF